MSARYDATHGESLSAVWGSWAKELYKDAIPRFARFADKVWGISEENEEKAAILGIEKTVDFFRSIGMPTSLEDLGVNPSDEDIKALALDATMQDTVKLSRIRPLGAAEVIDIYKKAVSK